MPLKYNLNHNCTIKITIFEGLVNLYIYISDSFFHFLVCYSIDRGCKDDCDLITLGSYRSVDNYELNGAKDTVSHYFKVCYFWGLKDVC